MVIKMPTYLLKVNDTVREQILEYTGPVDFMPFPIEFLKTLMNRGYNVAFRYDRKEVKRFGFAVLETDKELGEDVVPLIMNMDRYGFTEMRAAGSPSAIEWGY